MVSLQQQLRQLQDGTEKLVIVALTSLPIGYSVIIALTGLPIGYSVIVALTGLPIGYSVVVALTGLPKGYSVIVATSNRSPYRIQCNSSSNRSPYRIQCNSSSIILIEYSLFYRMRLSYEDQFSELAKRFDNEKESLQQHHMTQLKVWLVC